MKIGVIDVGGGSRDIFGAGIFDYCMDNQIHFDYGIGISAGSANMASYMAGQRGRNYVFYTEFFFRKEYVSIENFVRIRNYVDLDYPYKVLSNEGGEYPLDYDAMMNNPAEFLVEACDGITGRPRYFNKKSFERNNYVEFMASSCLPIMCKPVIIDDVPYFDGGLASPIPVKKALKDGCDKVVLILTKPKTERRTPKSDIRNSRFIERQYPEIARSIRRRASRYNKQLEYALELEKEGKLLILAPKTIMGMKTLTKDMDKLQRLYWDGFKQAKKIEEFIKG